MPKRAKNGLFGIYLNHPVPPKSKNTEFRELDRTDLELYTKKKGKIYFLWYIKNCGNGAAGKIGLLHVKRPFLPLSRPTLSSI